MTPSHYLVDSLSALMTPLECRWCIAPSSYDYNLSSRHNVTAVSVPIGETPDETVTKTTATHTSSRSTTHTQLLSKTPLLNVADIAHKQVRVPTAFVVAADASFPGLPTYRWPNMRAYIGRWADVAALKRMITLPPYAPSYNAVLHKHFTRRLEGRRALLQPLNLDAPPAHACTCTVVRFPPPHPHATADRSGDLAHCMPVT